MVLNTGNLDWESSALTTRLSLLEVKPVKNVWDEVKPVENIRENSPMGQKNLISNPTRYVTELSIETQ